MGILSKLPVTNPLIIFEIVKTHLLSQGVRAVKFVTPAGETPQCVYRGKNNTSCSAGCLITNEEYTAEMEEKRFLRVYKEYYNPNIGDFSLPWDSFWPIQKGYTPTLEKYNLTLISQLQIVHDDIEPELWAAYLKIVETQIQEDLTNLKYLKA